MHDAAARSTRALSQKQVRKVIYGSGPCGLEVQIKKHAPFLRLEGRRKLLPVRHVSRYHMPPPAATQTSVRGDS